MTNKNEKILKTYEMKTKLGKTSKTGAKRIAVPRAIIELLDLDNKNYARWIFSITEDGHELRIEFE